MEARACARYVRVTPQKARRVVDVIRGQRALEAVDVLRYAPQGAAEPVLKIVESAIANARYAAEQAGERSGDVGRDFGLGDDAVFHGWNEGGCIAFAGGERLQNGAFCLGIEFWVVLQ